MDKYVAFLDILGFKNMLKTHKHIHAARLIANFSSTAFAAWEKAHVQNLNGYIVSDSFIIYSNNASLMSLQELLDLINEICKREFKEHSLLIRGAIAKGEFDHLEAREISTLRKGLIVGQAYIDAYTMEESVKSIGIILSNSVYEDVCNLDNYELHCFEEKIESQTKYLFRYLTLDYLLLDDNMKKFVKLAVQAKWLPHYYNTLYFAMRGDNNSSKAHQIFDDIITYISDGVSGGNWRSVDTFIKNAFSNDVSFRFQTRFLNYLRSYLCSPNNSITKSINLHNKNLVLNFIANNEYATLSEISHSLPLSRATIHRTVDILLDEGKIVTRNGNISLSSKE